MRRSDNNMEAMERAYRHFAVVLIGSFALLCLIILIIADGGRLCAGNAQEEPVMISYGRIESIEFPEESCYLSIGSQLGLRLRTQPEIYDDVITWSSSDATVLRVDSSGIVTAYGSGTATITASCGNSSDSITVSVVDDILVSAAECIRDLSKGCDAGTLGAAKLMIDRLDRCNVEGAVEVSELIKMIISYITDGDSGRLDNAVSAAGLDSNLCRTAAVSCWAYGERISSEGVISFVGDCTLARYNELEEQGRFPSVYAASGSPTYPFDRVMGVFAGDDLTVINFEGTLTESHVHKEKSFYFRGAPEYASILPASSIEAANLANNHSQDYFQTGFDDTQRHLRDSGVAVFSDINPLKITVGQGEVPVVLIAASSAAAEYTDALHQSLLAAIKQHKNGDTVVIVNLHWGAEGAATPAEWQRKAAHELVDAGADMIVGHHSHVMQGIEMYNGKYIAYSLGNFAFGGNRSVSSPQTCILRAKLGRTADGAVVTGISVVPCRTTSTGTDVNNYQPMLCFDQDGDSVYSALISRSSNIGGVTEITRPEV